MQSLVNLNTDEYILCFSLLWSRAVCWNWFKPENAVYRSWKLNCDWLSGGNGMTSSNKQALVGRRVKTSQKALAGEATSFPVEHKAAIILFHLFLSCATCCASPPGIAHLHQLCHNSPSPIWFWPSPLPFARWRPPDGDAMLVHSEYVPKPFQSAAFDLQHHTMTSGLLVEVFIGNLVGPEDTTDFAGAPVVKCIDFLRVTFNHPPPFRAIE